MHQLLLLLLLTVTQYVTIFRGLWGRHVRLEALVEGWEADGPHTTMEGQVRASLAAQAWLGPLRPAAPRDPFEECGVPRTSSGWSHRLVSPVGGAFSMALDGEGEERW